MKAMAVGSLECLELLFFCISFSPFFLSFSFPAFCPVQLSAIVSGKKVKLCKNCCLALVDMSVN